MSSNSDLIAHLRNVNQQLKATDIARLFGVTRTTVYRMATQKRIPCYRIGKSWRFDPQTLIFWLRKKDHTMAQAEKAGA